MAEDNFFDVYQDDFEEDWPYCACGEDPIEEESAFNVCACCGKPLS